LQSFAENSTHNFFSAISSDTTNRATALNLKQIEQIQRAAALNSFLINLLVKVRYMNIYKYIKNPAYEVSDMGEYLSVFTGNMEQVFIFRDSEITVFNLFYKAISIDKVIRILINLYAESEADKVSIKNDCEHFITNLIKNKILIEYVTE